MATVPTESRFDALFQGRGGIRWILTTYGLSRTSHLSTEALEAELRALTDEIREIEKLDARGSLPALGKAIVERQTLALKIAAVLDARANRSALSRRAPRGRPGG